MGQPRRESEATADRRGRGRKRDVIERIVKVGIEYLNRVYRVQWGVALAGRLACGPGVCAASVLLWSVVVVCGRIGGDEYADRNVIR